MEAIVDLSGRLKGQLIFTQDGPNKPVKIEGKVCGFYPSDGSHHGIHVHEGNTLPLPGKEWEGPLCCGKGLGAHFNPYGKNHGSPWDPERHVGDLGNIVIQGFCNDCKTRCSNVNISDSVITLYPGKANILNRGLVIHEDKDDLGMGGNKESLITGNAGKRIGWGIIRLTK